MKTMMKKTMCIGLIILLNTGCGVAKKANTSSNAVAKSAVQPNSTAEYTLNNLNSAPTAVVSRTGRKMILLGTFQRQELKAVIGAEDVNELTAGTLSAVWSNKTFPAQVEDTNIKPVMSETKKEYADIPVYFLDNLDNLSTIGIAVTEENAQVLQSVSSPTEVYFDVKSYCSRVQFPAHAPVIELNYAVSVCDSFGTCTYPLFGGMVHRNINDLLKEEGMACILNDRAPTQHLPFNNTQAIASYTINMTGAFLKNAARLKFSATKSN
jgi:hypothetical protein